MTHLVNPWLNLFSRSKRPNSLSLTQTNSNFKHTQTSQPCEFLSLSFPQCQAHRRLLRPRRCQPNPGNPPSCRFSNGTRQFLLLFSIELLRFISWALRSEITIWKSFLGLLRRVNRGRCPEMQVNRFLTTDHSLLNHRFLFKLTINFFCLLCGADVFFLTLIGDEESGKTILRECLLGV